MDNQEQTEGQVAICHLPFAICHLPSSAEVAKSPGLSFARVCCGFVLNPGAGKVFAHRRFPRLQRISGSAVRFEKKQSAVSHQHSAVLFSCIPPGL